MGNGKISWTAENDAKLLVAILGTQNIKPNYSELAEKMTAMTGCDVTTSAIQNRLVKIKRQVQNNTAGEDATDSKKQSISKKNPVKKRKKAEAKGTEDEEHIKDDEEGRPIKKGKKDTLANQI